MLAEPDQDFGREEGGCEEVIYSLQFWRVSRNQLSVKGGEKETFWGVVCREAQKHEKVYKHQWTEKPL